MPDRPDAPKEFDGVVSLSEIVQYQSGGVVSRTILTAAFDALVLMIEGESEVSVSGVPQRLSAGDVMRLPAGRPHALKAVTRFKMLLVMVKE
jgi:quercetin dioxygenase-like cupin family protein